MNVLLANVQVDFKKCPSRPGFANDLGFSKRQIYLKNNNRVQADQELRPSGHQDKGIAAK